MKILRRLLLPLAALVLLVLLPLRRRSRRLALKKNGWAELRLVGEIVELQPARDVVQMLARRLLKRRDQPRVVLTRLRKFVDELSTDPYAKGVLVRMGRLGGGWAAADAVRVELLRIRESGRHLIIHLEGPVDNRQAMVAAVGTKVLMTPTAPMAAAGVASVGLFWRDALHRLGFKVEAISHGRFKSAPEQFTRTDRSEADREQTTAIVQQLDDALLDSLMAGRVLNRSDTEALIDAAPMGAPAAVAARFCDELARDEDLPEVLRKVEDADLAPTPIGAAYYLRVRQIPDIWPSRAKRVGVVRVHGPIIDQPAGLPLPEQQLATANTVVDDLRAALVDASIGAVVLHIDSRGGSVTASDTIFGAVARLDQQKPVIACLGDVAASGGYYVACAARSIVASPLTFTGSIGVFALMPTWAALSERLGIGRDSIKNRQHADIYDPWTGFDDQTRDHAQKEVDASYEAFIDLVAKSRELTRDEVDAVAQGRVWTGRDARQQRLLDDLGGFPAAVELAKVEAGGVFAADPVIVSARGPQPRPAPVMTGAADAATLQWARPQDALLAGEPGGSRPTLVELVQRLGFAGLLDPVAVELIPLATPKPGRAWTTLAYAPINSPE